MINQQKIKEWTDLFLAHIEEITPEVHVEKEEGYKFKSVNTFQQCFDTDLENPLATMLERSIENNNLVAGSWYFPRKMLLIFAEEYPEETKIILRGLFNENGSITERIDKADMAFSELMSVRNKKLGEDSHSFIGVRFLSLLLGYRFPDLYNPLKPREWKVFCRFVDDKFKIPSHTSSGSQYEVLAPYIETLRTYIKSLPQIQKLKDQLTAGLAFRDEEFRWMAQNVIFVTARVLANIRGESENKDVSIKDISHHEIPTKIITGDIMEFPLEEYLEDFIVKNWDGIDFGEKLELFVDEDGTSGQQYTTDVGIIDILAKDQKGNFVVIELKRGASDQKVIGQILSYIGWVRENLVVNKETVRGVIIVSEGNDALHTAQRAVADQVTIKYYRVKLDLINPNQ